MIDATLIETAARPNKYLDASDMAQDREEPLVEAPTQERLSADHDAKWVKKGRKSTLGYKGFARV